MPASPVVKVVEVADLVDLVDGPFTLGDANVRRLPEDDAVASRGVSAATA